ncbi:LIM domain kinase 1 isoform X2 [Scaptodrosophila lebanonensis]|uniref:non-specific serine/threonine protein kinase n=1 Tax=Drosophila lebanonensis TaxID=7225 RepID=A0A6J2TT27_DROLE|nr:LIM domain kinase 1 isoform X2 [Scaptodrosophila lebanonensis]
MPRSFAFLSLSRSRSSIICKFYGRVGKYAFSLLTSVAGRCCGSYRIDVNLTNLHIGDRILEVNGTPVSDSSVEQIDKLIRTEKILQLTVEHDPVQVCRSCSQADIQRACSASTLALPLTTSASSVEVGGRERLYKAAEQSAKARKMRKTAAAAAATAISNSNSIVSSPTTPLKEKERCSSLSKLLDEQHTALQHSAHPQLYDLSRTQSFRVVEKPQRIFRPSELVVGEKLGEGFFGKVYKVTHKPSGKVMVLKELHRADEEAQRNFLKEVAVLRQLDHRHVLKFIGVLYKDKKLHMVTEYVPGGCLKELIHDSGKTLSWTERVGFARDISCGMSYLHSMDIIHRDLNSMNCLVREDRSVVLADFGLARSVDAPRIGGAGSTAASGSGSINGDALSLASGGSPLSGSGTLRRSKSRQRRQRYTVVGNPYWMAPEMMKGLKYDEKVDIFSFGIMVCEIIGRIEADPDFMPRNSDFSLNQQEFREKFCANCPEAFFKVAFVCCDLNPDMRPCFTTLHVWLERLAAHLAVKQAPPIVLLNEIENFQESYLSSEDALSPTSQRSLDNLDVVCEQESPEPSKQQMKAAAHKETSPPAALLSSGEEKENVTMRTKDIPKSPHLGKDFSPTGERLRDSMRARRRQRFLGAQQQRRGLTPETTSTERALKHALKKCRPFGEKGFLVDLKPGAELQLQDVRDLNNYSDFDSSCDTSLNYQEANAPLVAEEHAVEQLTEQVDSHEQQASMAPPQELSKFRLAIEDIRTRLQIGHSKFEHLDEANRKNFSQSQRSMRNFFKTPPAALKMFQRLEHAALNGNDNVARTQRINQTPIFGRRLLPRIPLEHAESFEHLAPGPPKPPRRNLLPLEPLNLGSRVSAPAPAPKRSKAAQPPQTVAPPPQAVAPPPQTVAPLHPAPATPPMTLTCTVELHAAKIMPPLLPDYMYKKHKMTLPLSNASGTPPRSQTRATAKQKASKPSPTASPTYVSSHHPPSNCVPPTRPRPASPLKHLAQRHTAATAQRVHSAIKLQQQQQQTKTTRLNILSPEKVHRLNAKLSDQKQKLREEATAHSNGHGQGHTLTHGHGRVPVLPTGSIVERRKRAPPPPARPHLNTRC